MAQTLQRTPLFERHVAAGARMVPFAGWEMPVQYDGVIPEHRAVRSDWNGAAWSNSKMSAAAKGARSGCANPLKICG